MNKEDFKFLIPYSGSALIFMGAIRIILYYRLFTIDITSYLDFSEILTLFLNDIIFTFFIVLFTVIAASMTSISERTIIGLRPNLSEEKITKRIIAYNYAYKFPFIFFLISTVLALPLIFFGKYLIMALCLISLPLSLMLMITLVMEYRRLFFKQNNRYPRMLYLPLGIFITFLALLTSMTSLMEFEGVKNRKYYYGSTVTFKNKQISSDSIYYFIGKTKNYIFYYNEKEKNYDVYPMANVEKITIKIDQ
ncbi:hypothetical protein [Chitinophaga sp. MM2321]|uniref:hypothetical protein n=1 Tax=Chitinophaga sp. MM2321 TaxID=3137178 RepID=UPI0032D5A0FC